VIARHLLWKVPRRIGGVVNFKMLLLTRMGEALFKYLRPRGVEKFLHGPGNGIRGRMVNSIGTASIRQFGLKRLSLVPPGQMEDIVRGAIGLATEGFFEGVEAGRIVVHPNRTIARLLADDGQPAAELDDGTRLPADLIVCATGFTQGVPFLPADVTRQVLDERGNFILYRQIRPADVPGLYFNGYNSSFFSPLNAEMAAVWIAADLAGAVALPDPAAMRQQVVEQLAFMDVATDTHHCHGGKIIPFSLHNVDEVLGDLGVNISAAVRASHWLKPVDPAAYRRIVPTVLRRLPSVPAEPPAMAPVAEPVPGPSPVLLAAVAGRGEAEILGENVDGSRRQLLRQTEQVGVEAVDEPGYELTRGPARVLAGGEADGQGQGLAVRGPLDPALERQQRPRDGQRAAGVSRVADRPRELQQHVGPPVEIGNAPGQSFRGVEPPGPAGDFGDAEPAGVVARRIELRRLRTLDLLDARDRGHGGRLVFGPRDGRRRGPGKPGPARRDGGVRDGSRRPSDRALTGEPGDLAGVGENIVGGALFFRTGRGICRGPACCRRAAPDPD